MNDQYYESDDEVIPPSLSDEQVKRGCRVENGRVVCPPKKQDEGVVQTMIGEQKIHSIRCNRPKKGADKLICTTTSTSK